MVSVSFINQVRRKFMKTVTAWSVNVVWSDGTEQVLTEMPTYVSNEVDNWLTHLEEEVNAEESTEEGEDE
jgi:hypothetical protein